MRSPLFFLIAIVSLSLSTSFVFPTSVSGQEAAEGQAAAAAKPNYTIEKVDSIYFSDSQPNQLDDRKLRAVEKQINKMLKGDAPFNAANVIRYYKQNLFARMSDPQYFGDVAAIRDEIRENLRVLKSDVRAPYNEAVFSAVWGFASGNYHPTTRVNAIMVIGWLNDKEGTRNSQPVPFGNGTKALGFVLSKDNFTLAEKVAALSALKRHTVALNESWTDPDDAKYAAVVLAFVNSEKPASVTPEVDSTIKRIGLETLAPFALDNPEVVKLVMDSIKDKSATMALRTTALELLAKMPVEKLAEAEPTALAASVLQFSVAQVDVWKNTLTEKKVATAGDRGGRGGDFGDSARFSGSGARGNDDEDERMRRGMDNSSSRRDDDTRPKAVRLIDTQDANVRVARRYLQHVLQALHVGLDGQEKGEIRIKDVGLLAALDQTEDARVARDFANQVVDLQTTINDETVTDLKSLLAKLEEPLKELQKAAKDYPGVTELNERPTLVLANADSDPNATDSDQPTTSADSSDSTP